MATFTFNAMALPQGVTFVFGPWVCVTFVFGPWVCVINGSGGFDSHLNNPMGLESVWSEN
jgi:hypothetical protein